MTAPHSLLTLRQQAYLAAGNYYHARAAYCAALINQSAPAALEHALQTCHTTGTQFDAALTDLLQSLQHMKTDEAIDREIQRTTQLLESLRLELETD